MSALHDTYFAILTAQNMCELYVVFVSNVSYGNIIFWANMSVILGGGCEIVGVWLLWLCLTMFVLILLFFQV